MWLAGAAGYPLELVEWPRQHPMGKQSVSANVVFFFFTTSQMVRFPTFHTICSMIFAADRVDRQTVTAIVSKNPLGGQP